MKLNDNFLAVKWERQPFLKKFFLSNHLSDNSMAGMPEQWQKMRSEIANEISKSPKGLKIYYVTRKALAEASLVNIDKISLQWFSQIKDGHFMYVTGVNEFYRFYKSGNRINILNYFIINKDDKPYVWYDSYAILIEKGEMGLLPGQDQERVKKFIQALLFIELGDITVSLIKTGQKIKYGKKGDEKLLNDSGLNNVYLVNSNWNKILIIAGSFSVRGHFRVQPCGKGRSTYQLVWVNEYVKSGLIRRAGKEII